ncbi:hypothetical protein ACB092_05G187000 [Castanea dentata]
MVNGNLFRKLQYTDHDDHDRLSWKQRLRICIGVARAVHYLHTGVKHTIIHGDVKPANILLKEKWEAKLSDFKWSKMVPPGLSVVPLEITENLEILDSTMLGTLGYVDPEYRITSGLTDKSDVYSFGVVLFEVFVARKAIILLRLWKHQLHLASCSQKWKRELRETINHMIDP